MGAARLYGLRDLRRRWRTFVALGVAAAAGGLVLAAWARARRTHTSIDRFADITRFPHLVGPIARADEAIWDQIAALPEIEAAEPVMAQFHAGIGQTIDVQGSRTQTMPVVGQAVYPNVGNGSFGYMARCQPQAPRAWGWRPTTPTSWSTSRPARASTTYAPLWATTRTSGCRRRDDHPALRAMGMNRTQLSSAFGWQGMILAAVALVVGIPAGIVVATMSIGSNVTHISRSE